MPLSFESCKHAVGILCGILSSIWSKPNRYFRVNVMRWVILEFSYKRDVFLSLCPQNHRIHWIAMSTSAAQAIPSLISLVKCADAVLHDVLAPDAQLLHLTTYFDEAVHVKVSCHTLEQVFVPWLTWNSALSRHTTRLLSKKNSSRRSRLLSMAGFQNSIFVKLGTPCSRPSPTVDEPRLLWQWQHPKLWESLGN